MHGKESVAENISRCVSALNLETLENAYHSVRYKMDYYLIHARLKYYSNSKNPRVIHTKLDREQLTTLRTCPFDPYVVRPGEFLTLKPAYKDETLDTLLRLYGPDMRDSPPSAGSAAGAASVADENAALAPPPPKTRVRRSVLNRARWVHTGAAAEPRSPLTEMARGSTPDLLDVSFRSASHGSAPRPDENRPFRHGPKLAAKPQSARLPGDDPKVWQVVLSDISLSAARLSTGSAGTAKSDLENVTGDLTGARRRDVFADNLQQGRAKFHPDSGDPVGGSG